MPKASLLLVLLLRCGGLAAQPSSPNAARLEEAPGPRTPDAELDQYAAQQAGQAGSVPELARYLGQKATSDYDKARLIYAWIGQHIRYDLRFARRVAAGRRGPQRRNRPAVVLRRGSTVCAGYADLFTAVATAMGLRATTIIGDAKAGPALAKTPRGKRIKHAWNAFYAEGRWHLLDVTWGAGGVQGRHKPVFVPAYDAFWFDADPYAFLFWHLPAKPQWQGVAAPVKPKAFRALPAVDPELFAYGLDPQRLLDSALEAKYRLRLPGVRGGWPGIRLVQVPLTKRLLVGRPYTFVVAAPADAQLMLLNGTQPCYLQREGNAWRVTFKPAAGPVLLRVRTSATLWFDVLQYVAGPPRPQNPAAANLNSPARLCCVCGVLPQPKPGSLCSLLVFFPPPAPASGWACCSPAACSAAPPPGPRPSWAKSRPTRLARTSTKWAPTPAPWPWPTA
ncbi:hypothetical protein LJ737_25050 [Hymenobacter sp. 15J16-1T3B]|uniref:transglutaminase domain-containing protein n=1 Tax=Hymenobacter sp. 15J16-1T3B TaxID=2886941 RepID=UPI001D11903C|nr:transglutaminase domain-containing protein [Hymenobacter sp. 15J16-1T3B]MCC3160529.1 hypothetical protein [Hymenobacter sp. 15J16-1T3B]